MISLPIRFGADRVCRALLPWALLAAAAQAEIVTDGSLGARVALTGPDYQIEQHLGQRVGDNLFHSFQVFNLHTQDGRSETARFSGDAGIRRVISRVSGGEPSWIDGLLQSTVAGADLYFLNPAGVVFGPNAGLDVPASFHAATADELVFADGQRFSAHLSRGSLSAAAPEAFGYLSPQPASMLFQGSRLELRPDQAASFSAGTLRLHDTELRAPGGLLYLHAVGAADVGGVLELQRTQLDVSGAGAGGVLLRGDLLTLGDSGVLADNSERVPPDPDAGIDLAGARIELQNSSLSSAALARDDSGWLRAGVDQQGSGGSLRLRANRLDMVASGIATYTQNSARGGDIDIVVDSMSMQDSSLYAGTLGNGGDAGDIRLRVTALDGRDSTISTQSGLTPPIDPYYGNAGRIEISAGHLRMEQTFVVTDVFFGIQAATYGSGDGGAILLDLGQLSLSGGAEISSRAVGDGRGGDIDIRADEIALLGRNPSLDPDDPFSSYALSRIETAAYGDSPAGDIRIVAGRMHLDDLAEVSALGGSGGGGDIAITADAVELTRGGAVSALAFADGDAGSVRLQVAQRLAISDGQIDTSADSGHGGPILLQAGDLLLRNGLVTTSVAGGSGNGGDILVKADSLVLDTGFIQANTAAAGAAGGDIFIETPYLLTRYGEPPQVGDLQRQNFQPDSGINVIQAAAPGGEQGLIRIVTPELDVSGSLAPMNAGFAPDQALRGDPCVAARGPASSLVQGRRDSLPPQPGELSGVALTGRRLRGMLSETAGQRAPGDAGRPIERGPLVRSPCGSVPLGFAGAVRGGPVSVTMVGDFPARRPADAFGSDK